MFLLFRLSRFAKASVLLGGALTRFRAKIAAVAASVFLSSLPAAWRSRPASCRSPSPAHAMPMVSSAARCSIRPLDFRQSASNGAGSSRQFVAVPLLACSAAFRRALTRWRSFTPSTTRPSSRPACSASRSRAMASPTMPPVVLARRISTPRPSVTTAEIWHCRARSPTDAHQTCWPGRELNARAGHCDFRFNETITLLMLTDP